MKIINVGFKYTFYIIITIHTPDLNSVQVKSSMAKSLPVENLLRQNVGSIINNL